MNRLRTWMDRPLGLAAFLLLGTWACYCWTAQAMGLTADDSTVLAAAVIAMTLASYAGALHSLWCCLRELVRFFLLSRLAAAEEELDSIARDMTAYLADAKDFEQRLEAFEADISLVTLETLERLKAEGKTHERLRTKLTDRADDIGRRRKRLRKTAEVVAVLYQSPIRFILSRLGLRGRDTSTLLTSLALALAGPRHAHLRDAWHADLAGAPDEGIVVTPRQARALVLGFVVAGLKLRARSFSRPLWVPVDWILKSKLRTSRAVAAGVGAMVIYCEVTGGVHGLLVDGMGSGALLYGGLHALARTLRRHRSIELDAPDNPAASSSDS